MRSTMENQLGIRLATEKSFDSGLLKTVQWYLNNSAWVASVRSVAYQGRLKQSYGNRTAA